MHQIGFPLLHLKNLVKPLGFRLSFRHSRRRGNNVCFHSGCHRVTWPPFVFTLPLNLYQHLSVHIRCPRRLSEGSDRGPIGCHPTRPVDRRCSYLWANLYSQSGIWKARTRSSKESSSLRPRNFSTRITPLRNCLITKASGISADTINPTLENQEF